jgi:predicted aminopeptidase
MDQISEVKRTCQFVCLAALLLSGCRTVGFYSQAVGGQIEVLSKRKPIDRVIATTEDGKLRARLQLTKRLLKFAQDELQLPTNGSYEVYSEIGRKHLVWVVYASPKLSMEPKQWWYPLIGRQDYRGFFKKEQADKEIVLLEKQGLETWVNGVDAFSTLGWFRDPVMDTFVGREEVGYVELILHELVHQKHYRSGQTAFNEALAEAVAREGVRRWFLHTGRSELIGKYERWLDRISQARDAIGGTSVRLKEIYQSRVSDDRKRNLKEKEIAKLKERLRELRTSWGTGLKSWIEEPINNARLNSFTTYEAGVPRFTALIQKCDGDFERFWKAVKKMEP